MRLHNILDDLFACGSKVRILRLLFRREGREYTEREIALEIGMSPNTVNLALADLRNTNVVLFKHIGKTNIYVVNRKSILFPFLKDLFSRERELLKGVYSQIVDKLPQGDTAIVFGSFARGEEEHDSDLDVLVISKKPKRTKAVVEDLLLELIDSHAVVLSSIVLTREEFNKKRKMPYIRNALDEGVLICGAV